jgi:integrase
MPSGAIPSIRLFKITALYGLRRSELMGLQWDSVNFDGGKLTIQHTVCKMTTTIAKDKTKNASSFRSFPLTDEARSIFRDAKKQETENRHLFGKVYQENSYVLKRVDGRLYSPDYITQRFSNLLKNHGLPHIWSYELRHSCASLLLNTGFTLKDVQKWMGHADIKMTANIYGHLDLARKQSMAERLSRTLSETR